MNWSINIDLNSQSETQFLYANLLAISFKVKTFIPIYRVLGICCVKMLVSDICIYTN